MKNLAHLRTADPARVRFFKKMTAPTYPMGMKGGCSPQNENNILFGFFGVKFRKKFENLT